MHAYLITGAAAEKRLKEAQKLLKSRAFEVIHLETETAHHITSIRELNHNLSLRPAAKRGVLVEDAQLLTQEAANSFLKTLEEPPEDTTIILTAPARELVLETISSRAQHIDLGPPIHQISQEEKKKHEKLLHRLLKAGVGERFLLAEEYAGNRKQATNFVIGQIFATRELLFKRLNNPKNSPQPLHLIELIERLDRTRRDLEANVNVKMTISDLLLHYPEV